MQEKNKNSEQEHVDEREFVNAFLKFRSFSWEKQAFAIAFMNGMEFQKSISEADYEDGRRNQKQARASQSGQLVLNLSDLEM